MKRDHTLSSAQRRTVTPARLVCCALSLAWAACGSASEGQRRVLTPKSSPVVLTTENPVSHSEPEAVAVSGIEGSMSSYDVRMTMEQRGIDLAACHEPRARKVPVLAGSAEFAIAVGRDGQVGEVALMASSLGDRPLERCVSEIIQTTAFPRPHGGDAKITWTMQLEPVHPEREPESWDRQQVARVLDKRLPELRERCIVSSEVEQFDVTAYINRRGRVVTAGVATRGEAQAQDLDCIVDALRSWPMPKPKQTAYAKLTFSLDRSLRSR